MYSARGRSSQPRIKRSGTVLFPTDTQEFTENIVFLKMQPPANNHTFYLVSLKKFLGKQTSKEPTSLEPWDVT